MDKGDLIAELVDLSMDDNVDANTYAYLLAGIMQLFSSLK